MVTNLTRTSGNMPLSVGRRGDQHLSAGYRGREELPRVHGLGGVEHLLDPPHRVEIRLAVDPRHVVVLLEADAVLAGNRASDLHAHPEHLLPRPADAPGLP